LRAHHDVDVDAELRNTGGGELVLRADKDGVGAGTVKLGTSIFSTGDVRIYYNPDDNNKDLLVGDTRRVNPASYTAPGLFNIGGGAVAYMLVNDVYDLQNVANNLSGNYALGRDVDASAARGWNAGQGFDPIGQDVRDSNSVVDFGGAFSGVFDGLGHVISHLRSVGWSLDGIGLFSLTSAGAVVRNVGLDDVTVSGGSTFTGGLVGENYGLIEDAFSRGAVSGSIAVGGLVGGNVGTIVRAYSEGTVSGDSEVGGLVGENSSFFTRPDGTGSYDSSKGEIRNAYADAQVTASGVSAGGLVGVNLGTIVGAYSIGAVSGPRFTGGLVGASDGLDSEGGIHHAFWDITTSGATAGTGGGSGGPGDITPVQSANPTPAVGEPAYAFDHAAYTGFSFGATPRSGTWFMIDGDTRPMLQAEYSTEIRNAHQLQLMTMAPDAAYTLAADVDLGPDLAPVDGHYPGLWTSAGFVPVGDDTAPFGGSFDGSGHVIEHLRIDRPRDELGLFGQTGGGATIRRVGLQDVAVSGEDLVGGLVGVNLGTITDAYVDGDVRGDEVVGGLVGRDEVGTIRTSYSAGQVSGASVVGGLVGQLFDGDATAVYSTAAVSGDSYVGGLVGILSDGSIEQSYSSGRVIGESEVGGLVGVGSGVNESYWDSTSSGQLHARGNGNDAGATELQSTDGKFAKATYAFAAASYPQFDFGTSPGSATWFIVDGYTRPFLQMEYGTVVHNAHQLQLLDLDRSADYTLAQSIDLGPALGPQNGTYPGMWSAAGFAPIDWANTNPFDWGSLDGGGHLIEHLAINRPDDDSIGLFSMLGLATEVQRLGLSDVQILGKGAVGAFAGTNYGLVRDVYATGSVHGDGTVGGLVGVDDEGGQLLDTYSAATVRSRHTPPGGIVGTEFVGRVSAGFWDTDSSGVRAGSGPGNGLGTAQMKQAATFRSAGWDFNGTWAIKEGISYPYFQ
ncbi:MAG TPA: GLUG motif-containing protein, partial [Limnochordia bacterium]|nr:GLUG motif-containing protein [Limnochordia bacterium]